MINSGRQFLPPFMIGGGTTGRFLKFKGNFTPTASAEYPTDEIDVDDFWIIDGLTEDGYTFTSGNLAGETVYNQSALISLNDATWFLQANRFVLDNNYHFSQSLGEDSTTNSPDTGGTGAGWINKLFLFIPETTLEIGLYEISVMYGWSGASTGRDFIARIVDNGTEVYIHKQEPKDAGVDQKYQQFARRIVDVDYAYTSMNRTIQLDFASEVQGTRVWIREASLTIKRVK